MITFRRSIGAAVLMVLAACSPSEQPSLSDDLKQDLARVDAGDIQFAGGATTRVEVVSAAERTDAAVAAPKAPTVSRAPSAVRGRSAAVRSARRESAAVAQPAPRAEATTPVEEPRAEAVPEPVPARARVQAPLPSTQREPPGGWRSTGEVIRNAPFPIKP